ncbi:Indigoidine synthase A like protein-domain-containing protein [Tuber borchii]|uniref:Indigoidine synthase A like protein-domain-containing protein n=1 Tax=Tuber borchii TaxID=42251 RepID=A0A2T6ZPU5_TUBBO|nr:Indigoidine synthase A like protein-domain-containing protein [Tuber borchii]
MHLHAPLCKAGCVHKCLDITSRQELRSRNTQIHNPPKYTFAPDCTSDWLNIIPPRHDVCYIRYRLPRHALRIPYTPPTSCRHRTYSNTSRLNKPIQISEAVREALVSKTPIVALETAIYTHGFPYPDNVGLAVKVEAAIRESGAVPATIGILDGIARVGFSQPELERLASTAGQNTTIKVSRRDLPFVVGMRHITAYNGGTTIAGTMLLAHMAGIKVFATGGLGGVHRGYPNPMDVSADLMELGRTNVANTFEVLETQGVFVGTFGKAGAKVMLPAFYNRESNIISPNILESPRDAAGLTTIPDASHTMGLTSGQLFCNPIPEEFEIPAKDINKAISEAVEKARNKGVFGKDQTPYILNEIKEITKGASLPANIALVLSNARMGAQVARELVFTSPSSTSTLNFMPPATPPPIPPPTPINQSSTTIAAPEILVIGSLAIPQLHTSNPTTTTETLGGVGKNVTLAAHLAGANARLVSVVGKDLAGAWALEKLGALGMDVSGVRAVNGGVTARYVATNNSSGELFIAGADMRIFEGAQMGALAKGEIFKGAKVVCVDGNLSMEGLAEVVKATSELNIPLIFEPTSTSKSTRILSPTLPIYPSTSAISLTTPNTHELTTMFTHTREIGMFEREDWWRVIDNISIDSMFLNTQLSTRLNANLLEEGIIQSAVHLSPYFSRIMVKLGADGVVLVQLFHPATSSTSAALPSGAIVSRGTGAVRGIAVRHFPAEAISQEDIVSVNGAGDTFLGAVLAGLAKLGMNEVHLGEVISRPQKAACLTLRSPESVSERVAEIGWR